MTCHHPAAINTRLLQVFLSLQVRVDPDWRGSVDALTKYGYIESDFA